jgi:hypothetical protein
MSDIKDTGGPAFPFSFEVAGDHRWAHGMTLRDYFAAEAMKGLIASNDEGAGDRILDVPTYAYEIADGMLEARKQ